jgi:diacylglycerol kinase (ATP)
MMVKEIAIILNGISLYKKTFYKKFLPLIQERYKTDVFETNSRHDGILLSSKAAEKYRYDVILAAGGDGTLHQVMNGVLNGRETEPRLPVIGVIPIGSGNDFAKTAKITTDPGQLLHLLEKFQSTPVNIGKIIYQDFSGGRKERYFLNVADIGMGPEVVKRVLDSGRALGSEVAYYKSIIATFFKYRPMIVHASTLRWKWSGKLRSLAVANGRFYGHGLCIAPDARPDDDLFTVFICGDVSVIDFIKHSSTMKKQRHIQMDEVLYKEAISIELLSEKPCLIEGDGEILGQLPASVQLISRKLNFLM